MDPIDERLTRAGAAWRDAQPPVTAAGTILPHRRSRPTLARLVPLVGIAAVLAVILAVAPALLPSAGQRAIDMATPPTTIPIPLLTAAAPPSGCLDVLIGGSLVRDPVSGLGLGGLDGASQPVRWPYGFTAYERAGRAVLMNAAGQPVAIDGDPIGFGTAGMEHGIQTACDPSLTAFLVVPGRVHRPNQTQPLTADELLTLVGSTPATDTTPMVVVASTAITIGAGAPPPVVGWIGSSRTRFTIGADPAVATALPPDGTVEGTYAFSIASGAVTLLGRVLPSPGVSLLRDLGDVAMPADDALPVGSLVAVDGWLVNQPQLCPAFRPGRSFDPALPFGGCGEIHVADRPADASVSIPVQDAAWDEFADLDGLDLTLPRHGVYLLRRVADPNGGRPGMGWSVIARLEPATVPPGGGAAASPTP